MDRVCYRSVADIRGIIAAGNDSGEPKTDEREGVESKGVLDKHGV